jgi:hypothetical protein
MRKSLSRVLPVLGALALRATPAWAHPSASPHIHPSEMGMLLAVAVGLVGFWWMLRGRSRAG